MSASYYTYLVLGFPVTDSDFFDLKESGFACPQGHTYSEGHDPFCPKDGLRVRKDTKRVPKPEVESYVKSLGLEEKYYVRDWGGWERNVALTYPMLISSDFHFMRECWPFSGSGVFGLILASGSQYHQASAVSMGQFDEARAKVLAAAKHFGLKGDPQLFTVLSGS